MGIGTFVRHRLGRLEIPAAELYRRFFIDLDHLGGRVAALHPAKRILEVGCGDGALAQRLTTVFPTAEYLGIDPAATAGRLYRGDPARAEFRRQDIAMLAAGQPDPFDLVVIVDVLHHIPATARPAVLRHAAALTAAGGLLLVKEWARDRPVAGRLAYWADRYVTGDRDVEFMTEAQLATLLGGTLPEFTRTTLAPIPPWRENVLVALERTTDSAGPGRGAVA
ncbi:MULTISPECIES: class I SAM-dependent methyltransferase [unclassified Solwaraspora]|uniref:class I SAM-dependent methyltransferase n=1 Tax=unclassified Solwaraspora TaxID=2627926 RepID=UPI00259B8D9C|nr:class I SAM-dependent methyltransferase [Solwaraspora sp. WMMA2056]WJK38999.1 class I SAM-dependent methyltransferase [Solwaraspora sp. WMMA2056]